MEQPDMHGHNNDMYLHCSFWLQTVRTTNIKVKNRINLKNRYTDSVCKKLLWRFVKVDTSTDLKSIISKTIKISKFYYHQHKVLHSLICATLITYFQLSVPRYICQIRSELVSVNVVEQY